MSVLTKNLKIAVADRWGGNTGRSAMRGPLILALAVAWLVVHAVVVRFDDFLLALHIPGTAAYGLRSFTDVSLSPPVRMGRLAAAFIAWASSDEKTGHFATRVFAWAVGLELLLACILTALALLLIDATQTIRFDTVHADIPDRYFGHWGRLARFAVVGSLLAALLEYGVLLWLGLSGAASAQSCGVPLLCSPQATLLAFGIAATTLLALLVGGYFVGATVLWLRHGQTDADGDWRNLHAVRAGLSAARLPLLLVVIIGAGLSLPEQMPDMLRSWIDHPSPAVMGTVLMFGFGAFNAFASWWLLHVPDRENQQQHSPDRQNQPRRGSEHEHQQQPTRQPDALRVLCGLFLLYVLLWFAFWSVSSTLLPVGFAVVGVALVLGGFSAAQRWRPDWSRPYAGAGWVLAVTGLVALTLVGRQVADGVLPNESWGAWKSLLPVVLVGAVWVLGWPFRAWKPSSEPTPPAGPGVLPCLLAGAPSVLLGSAVVGTCMDVLLYDLWQEQGPVRALPLLASGAISTVAGVGAMWGASTLSTRFRFNNGAELLHEQWPRLWSAWVPWFALVGAVLISIAVAGVLASDPFRLQNVSSWIGSIGLIALAMLVALGAGFGLLGLADTFLPTPALYRVLGYRHVPVLSLALIWWVLAEALPPEGPTHDARLVPATTQNVPPSGGRGETLRKAFDAWTNRNASNTQVAGTQAIPLVLVATAGGGIRAAAWTTYVLDRVLGYDDPTNPCNVDTPLRKRKSSFVFAESGISGGSVGLATYAQRQGAYDARGVTDCAAVPVQDIQTDRTRSGASDSPGWIRSQLGVDGVAATVGWFLFEEGPWSLLRYPLLKDRAAVLEDTWDTYWWQPALPTAPAPTATRSDNRTQLFDLAHRAPTLPFLILNGLDVETGCRISTSVLSLSGRPAYDPVPRCVAPGLLMPSAARLGTTIDLVDMLCPDRDLRLSTAALLSARWPYISPSGRITRCGPPPDASGGTPARMYAVDGGYGEGSGAATLMELWTALAPFVDEYNLTKTAEQPFIVPFVIQIDNSYDEPAGPDTRTAVPQFLVPPHTFMVAGGTESERTRQALQLGFNKPFPLPTGVAFCDTRYAHFDLRAHPGPSATVGWTLSSVAFDDLVRQLRIPPQTEYDPLVQVENWWQPRVGTCAS